jgi:hypothetical protein
MMRFSHLGVVALLLSGCAGTAQQVAATPAQQRSLDAPAAAVRARVERALREVGLAPEPAPGGRLRAVARGAPDSAWADCPRVVVRDESTEYVRSHWAAPGARETAVSVSLRPAGEGRTEVTVAAESAATYTDRYRNLPFREACATTGALERRLLEAAAAG